jgi:hypothetical protein
MHALIVSSIYHRVPFLVRAILGSGKGQSARMIVRVPCGWFSSRKKTGSRGGTMLHNLKILGSISNYM